MHLIAMLGLIIIGYAAGENISWLLGFPIICSGIYMLDVGGKKASAWRYDQENLFSAIGLLSFVLLIVATAMGW